MLLCGLIAPLTMAYGEVEERNTWHEGRHYKPGDVVWPNYTMNGYFPNQTDDNPMLDISESEYDNLTV